MAGSKKAIKSSTTSKLWGGRFKKSVAPEVIDFSESLSFDHELALHDIEQSRVHVSGLQKAKLLTPGEVSRLKSGLNHVERLVLSKKLPMPMEYEDIHTAIEKKLVELTGNTGKKLHTARSRNDQVATDLRLYLKKSIKDTLVYGRIFVDTLCLISEKEAASVMPGYTHLQRAMPVTMGHHLMAYAAMFTRDLERFKDALNRLDEMPLGAGALAGSNHKLPREANARAMGFREPVANSLDAVSDRDGALETLSACAILFTHLSRLCEDIILWASTEFQFVSLDDAYATGSSLMPQKKNPDIAELVRGKSARATANMMGLLTLLKGLPLSYNRDLQEDKIYVFDSMKQTIACLKIMVPFMKSLQFNHDKMKSAVDSDPTILATDLADILVREGVPFRETHEVVGRIVSEVLDRGVRLQDLSDADYKKIDRRFPVGTALELDVNQSVNKKKAYGGTSPSNVRSQVRRIKSKLERLKG